MRPRGARWISSDRRSAASTAMRTTADGAARDRAKAIAERHPGVRREQLARGEHGVAIARVGGERVDQIGEAVERLGVGQLGVDRDLGDAERAARRRPRAARRDRRPQNWAACAAAARQRGLGLVALHRDQDLHATRARRPRNSAARRRSVGSAWCSAAVNADRRPRRCRRSRTTAGGISAPHRRSASSAPPVSSASAADDRVAHGLRAVAEHRLALGGLDRGGGGIHGAQHIAVSRRCGVVAGR